MNKELFIKNLKDVLLEHETRADEINEVLLDYQQMYDDALERGLSDEEVYELLGNPSQIYAELRDTLTYKQTRRNREKIIALTPFIAVITFLLIGFLSNVWHPTWLIFLLIPVTAISLNGRQKDKVIALSPFVAVIGFMIIGTYTGYWNPAWLIFLIIPITAVLYEKETLKKILFIGSMLIAISFYLYMGYIRNDFSLGLIGFLLPLIVILYYAEVKFELVVKDPLKRKNALAFVSMILLSMAIFAVLGFLFDGWGYAWMVFLAIPISSIYLFGKTRLWTPYMPFIAVIIFYSLGYFFGLFYISWIAFLLIPIVAIIENA